jgi:phospholipid transport system transporter-binding protein
MADLQLPATVTLDEAGGVWAQLDAALRAEALQVRSGAGRDLRLSAANLTSFDSSTLSVLLGCARLAAEHGLRLVVTGAPDQLRALAGVYGLSHLIWPSEAAPA